MEIVKEKGRLPKGPKCAVMTFANIVYDYRLIVFFSKFIIHDA